MGACECAAAMSETFPWGWFGVGFTRDLPARAAIPATVNGRELAVYRAASGSIVALDAHCPHLGAHMGRGGTVEGDELRCHFHGFCFDASGQCTRTGYGKRVPPKAVVRSYPAMDFGGVIAVWFDPEGRPPVWTPTFPDTDGWCEPRGSLWTFASRPQEVAENAVDIGHLSVVHGYTDARVHGDVRFDRFVLTGELRFSRRLPLFGRRGPLAESQARVTQHGLGLAVVETLTPALGIETRFVVATTALDANTVALRTTASIRSLRYHRALRRIGALLPTRLIDRLAMRSLHKSFEADVAQDVPIWSHKRALERPAIAEGDGPIGKYRGWARRYYTAPRVELPMLVEE